MRALLAFAATSCLSCGPWLPLPPRSAHGGETPVVVPTAPPPPEPEMVPPKPESAPDAVWIDGQWRFLGVRWEWESGRWEVPPPDATYAPPAVLYLPDQRIVWFEGHWHTARALRSSDRPSR